mgnify:FL=1
MAPAVERTPVVNSHHSVVVIGAGQAGLSVAYALQQRGIRPLVLEKNRIGYSWDQQRWDSFCLVTPNWQCCLPDLSLIHI